RPHRLRGGRGVAQNGLRTGPPSCRGPKVGGNMLRNGSERSNTVAVVGLGSMGGGMAVSLLKAGFDVAGCDRDQAALERLRAAGGRTAETPAAAAEGADIVVCVVVNAAQTEAVLFGEGGVAAVLPQGAVFVSCATLSPDAARDFA